MAAKGTASGIRVRCLAAGTGTCGPATIRLLCYGLQTGRSVRIAGDRGHGRSRLPAVSEARLRDLIRDLDSSHHPAAFERATGSGRRRRSVYYLLSDSKHLRALNPYASKPARATMSRACMARERRSIIWLIRRRRSCSTATSCIRPANPGDPGLGNRAAVASILDVSKTANHRRKRQTRKGPDRGDESRPQKLVFDCIL